MHSRILPQSLTIAARMPQVHADREELSTVTVNDAGEFDNGGARYSKQKHALCF
jgi:hypothetical protein